LRKQIVEALKLKLSFSEKVSLTKRHTVNAQAYDLYLRGPGVPGPYDQAQRRIRDQLFEKAIELDPRYAAAYAACSSAYGQRYQYFAREEVVSRPGTGTLVQGADVRRPTCRKRTPRWDYPTSYGESSRRPAASSRKAVETRPR